MIRKLSMAALLAAALVMPALAEETKVKGPAAAVTPQLRGALFTEQQAREHLARGGYTNVSELTRNENGQWLGSATKDGKAMTVAVDVKGGVVAN